VFGEILAEGEIGKGGRLPRVMLDGMGGQLELQVGDDKWEITERVPLEPQQGRSVRGAGREPSSIEGGIDDIDPYSYELRNGESADSLPQETITSLLQINEEHS
jgi:hypothetical protein